MSEIRLTHFSRGSGCGCKIAPGVLEEILHSKLRSPANSKLIVGNASSDDAAVYDLGNGQGLISTTDFFTPVLDDPYDFGRVAAANAISDVYAMGGKPLLAVAILGWPIDKIPAAVASRVLEGGNAVCAEAGIPLAGGHSINSTEPIFGLAVNGLVDLKNLKRNCTAREGDLLYLTKRIGVGILSAAEKRGKLKEEHKGVAAAQMVQLNSVGEQLGKLPGVHAMTDVTGFGLLGHLIEMAGGSGLSAQLDYSKIPLIPGLETYTSQMCVPDNTFRNWKSYENKVSGITGDALFTLCDPQTNGGLLISVDPAAADEAETLTGKMLPIGKMVAKANKTVELV